MRAFIDIRGNQLCQRSGAPAQQTRAAQATERCQQQNLASTSGRQGCAEQSSIVGRRGTIASIAALSCAIWLGSCNSSLAVEIEVPLKEHISAFLFSRPLVS